MFIMGCSSTPLNTSNPSAFDVLFRYDDLQDYLSERRLVLKNLEFKLSNLNSELLSVLGDLKLAEKSLSSSIEIEQQSNDLLMESQKVLKEHKENAHKAFLQTLVLQDEKSMIEKKILTNKQEAEAEKKRLVEIEKEIRELEQKKKIFVRVTEAIETSRENQILRSEQGIR